VVDNCRAITITVVVTVLFDNYCLVAIAMITISNHFTFADAIPVLMARANRYANRPNSDANLFRTGWYRTADAYRRNKN